MLWLSLVVFPCSGGSSLVRSSLIVLASELAQRRHLADAPRVLCEIYRGLGEMISHPKGPMSCDNYFPAHFFTAWLGLPWTFGHSYIAFDPNGEILLRRPSRK